MIRKLSFLLLIIVSSAINAQETNRHASFFLNLGQSIPLGAYKAKPTSTNPIEVANTSHFAKSFNMGLDLYLLPKLGLTLGATAMQFDLDKTTFEKVHGNNLLPSDSYLGEHRTSRRYLGITTRFSYHKFNIEPRISIGISNFITDNADYYQKDSNNEIYRTISYSDVFVTSFPSYNGGFNLSYNIVAFYNVTLGLQLFSELSYQKPEIKYDVTKSNKMEGTIKFETHSYEQEVVYLYFGVGLTLKIKDSP